MRGRPRNSERPKARRGGEAARASGRWAGAARTYAVSCEGAVVVEVAHTVVAVGAVARARRPVDVTGPAPRLVDGRAGARVLGRALRRHVPIGLRPCARTERAAVMRRRGLAGAAGAWVRRIGSADRRAYGLAPTVGRARCGTARQSGRFGASRPRGLAPRGMMPGSVKEVTVNQKMADAKAPQQTYAYIWARVAEAAGRGGGSRGTGPKRIAPRRRGGAHGWAAGDASRGR